MKDPPSYHRSQPDHVFILCDCPNPIDSLDFDKKKARKQREKQRKRQRHLNSQLKMICGVLASASPQTFPSSSSSSSSLVSKPKTSCFSYASSSVRVPRVSSLDLKIVRFGLYGLKGSRRGSRVHCNTGPGMPNSVLELFSRFEIGLSEL